MFCFLFKNEQTSLLIGQWLVFQHETITSGEAAVFQLIKNEFSSFRQYAILGYVRVERECAIRTRVRLDLLFLEIENVQLGLGLD